MQTSWMFGSEHTIVAVGGVIFLALAAGTGLVFGQQAEQYVLAGNDIAIYNLVGEMRVETSSSDNVLVEVTRGGDDADRLRIETGRMDGRQTLRVLYPDDRIGLPQAGTRRAPQGAGST